VRPVVLAGERRLVVPGPLGEILPGGGLQRGSVVRVEGTPGSGATSLLLALLATATATGEWAAMVDADGVLGGLAAAEAGVALERLVVVRAVPAALYGRVVATLLDGVTVVGATIPRGFRLADARRLEARARERAAVLVAAGSWPGESSLRLRAEHSSWSGLGRGEGLLVERTMRVAVTGRGSAGRERVADVVTGVRFAA
jgi:RecA DNA recombination protein